MASGCLQEVCRKPTRTPRETKISARSPKLPGLSDSSPGALYPSKSGLPVPVKHQHIVKQLSFTGKSSETSCRYFSYWPECVFFFTHTRTRYRYRAPRSLNDQPTNLPTYPSDTTVCVRTKDTGNSARQGVAGYCMRHTQDLDSRLQKLLLTLDHFLSPTSEAPNPARDYESFDARLLFVTTL